MTRHRQPATPPTTPPGHVAHGVHATVYSTTVAALPLLNHFLQRLRLEAILQAHLKPDDRRNRLPTARGILLLVRNLLLAREPLYGLGDWAAAYEPELLGLSPTQRRAVNDDRVGRCLTCFFHSDRPGFLLELVRHVVQEFQLRLDELHNDSTTISFFGAYAEAATAQPRRDQQTLAITWGHSKDHRPDLKQLLYILTISEDGGVPIHFRAANGNVTDDTTHRDNWELLCQIAGRRDFLYVADCKLATIDNMNYLAARGGRFVSVLPRTRKEDATFRQRLRAREITWQPLWEKTDAHGKVVDQFAVCPEPGTLPEGYRVWWFHSSRKAALDLAARSQRLQRAEQQLRDLQQKLRAPRARRRDPGKVQDFVAKLLDHYQVAELITVTVRERSQETYRQQRRGRPGTNTAYVKQVRTRLDLEYALVAAAIAHDRLTDGIFPLVSNDDQLTALQVLHAYKRQPAIEKRFEQLKTDFAVAPVFLKDVGRIEALFTVYFVVLLVEALVERELRQAMARAGLEALALYPERRPCRRPTTRRVIDVFAPIQRHTLHAPDQEPQRVFTALSGLQRQLLRLLGVPTTSYCG